MQAGKLLLKRKDVAGIHGLGLQALRRSLVPASGGYSPVGERNRRGFRPGGGKTHLETRQTSRRHGTVQLDTDERMLAEGKTWHDILAYLAEPSNVALLIEAHTYRSPSPSSDGDTDLSGYNTLPPTPTDLREKVKRGPRPEGPALKALKK